MKARNEVQCQITMKATKRLFQGKRYGMEKKSDECIIGKKRFHGDPPKDGCTNEDCCNGDDSFSGRKSGTVGISSKMCCTTPGGPVRPCNASSARMTPCTRASCDGASSHAPLGPGATGGIDAPRPSQMHRSSLPGMTWHSRPVSTCRTSMKRESKMRMYGGCHATCSAVPSHSIVPFVRLGSPCRFTYNPNSERKGETADRESS